jgi:Delta7-sterol 5-desaturase
VYTTTELVTLLIIAALGHALALFWYTAYKNEWAFCGTRIYAVPIKRKQLRRELRNSIHSPSHAIVLFGFLGAGFFPSRSALSLTATLILTMLWAEVWHYASHRAFHLRQLHWIHAEHHKSRINSPFTALSFSFTEKFIFDLGLICPLALLDRWQPLNFFGIAFWFIGYLIINSYSHANFEIKSAAYLNRVGKMLTSTTYHSLHHSRYRGNYGLGIRLPDRIFGTECDDYERVFQRVTQQQLPLANLGEVVKTAGHP